jgi:hypothetical protein
MVPYLVIQFTTSLMNSSLPTVITIHKSQFLFHVYFRSMICPEVAGPETKKVLHIPYHIGEGNAVKLS